MYRWPTYEEVAQLAELLSRAVSKAGGQPACVMMSGLPGTGKSYVSHLLARRLPGVEVNSDQVRKYIFGKPTYESEESRITHGTCHTLLRTFLRNGYHAIYDATNLVEHHREQVYRLTDEVGARLLIVHTVAPEDVVRKRLEHRSAGEDERDFSDADWDVYRMFLSAAEWEYGREVIRLDTSVDVHSAIRRIARLARAGSREETNI